MDRASFSTSGSSPPRNHSPGVEVGETWLRETGKQTGVDGVVRHMTVLGATVYLGFIALAVLWLVLTAETDQDQLPERSNSDSTAADSEVSSPWALSQSASK